VAVAAADSGLPPSPHLDGNLERFPARLLGREIAVQPQSDPALTARRAVHKAVAVGDGAGLETAGDEANWVGVGNDPANGQSIDCGLTDLLRHGLALIGHCARAQDLHRFEGNSRKREATRGNVGKCLFHRCFWHFGKNSNFSKR